MADPVNSSDEAVNALVETLVAELGQRGPTYRRALHRLAAAVRAEAVADPDAQPCTSCEGPTGNPDTFCDACKLDELEQECDRLRAKLAEAVADERRRAVEQVRHDMELLADRVNDYTPEGVRIRLRNYAAQLERSLAAGSVPVATPEPPTSCERCGHPVHAVGCLARPLAHGGTYTCGCGGPSDVRTVATPEPVDEWECPECGATTRARMADKAATPPAEPADPPPTSPFEFLATACDHPGATGPHRCRPEWLTTWTTLPWCPGPVSVPKESSE